ncbi:MAG: tyrosine-type recombinase/integrase [Candidatus Scalindua sp.]|nr:tyrosine-type recombinase/integrase [Candidatus Scalindua sp.]MCP4367517.1 tyrosine-type recombinase/integrase [Deltaproteobacteria bacterium]
MNKYPYYGPFKTYIQEFIELKQAVGYKYFSEAGHLKRFDNFTLERHSSASTLTKEIVMEWCTKKPYEKQENLCARASIIRQFAIYIDNLGVNAYIIPKNHFKSGERYVPYIYTEDELKRFFQETDRCHYCSKYPYRHLIMPILFRMIYSCGLRVSEARLLKVKDVDLNSGILTINQSKKDNSRLIPMKDKLTRKCQIYSKEVHSYWDVEHYYFPLIDSRPITIGNIYKNFRRFLWRSGISHRGRGSGPRIHDFRHSFAVHCLKKWYIEGKDLMTYLPILRVFLGHDSFKETAYYLRLTADVFPEITLKLEILYADLIPVLEGGTYESY